jgi:hypothetical protein
VVIGSEGKLITRSAFLEVVKAGGLLHSKKERSTDVFVREHGRWKCGVTQLTTIAEK